MEVRNLTKVFRQTVVNDLSLTVERGAIYGLLGPNGSGKSTTFGMLLGTIRPTSGSWSWFGQEGTSTETLKRIGAIIEQPNFYPYLSATDNLKIVAQIKGAAYSRIDDVLKLVGLLERKNDPFSTFSLGMKQRLSIASALLNEPEVLILDEPTNGLDPEGIIQIRELIQIIAKQGITILIASHLLDEVEKICDHVIVLKRGSAIYSGRVDSMSAGNGYFELEADDVPMLLHQLSELNLFEKIEEKEGKVTAIPKDYLAGTTLNRMLAERGLYLSHLNLRKASLESQFLELVKNSHT